MKTNSFSNLSTEELQKKENLIKKTLIAFIAIWIAVLIFFIILKNYLFFGVFAGVALTTLSPSFINLKLINDELKKRKL